MTTPPPDPTTKAELEVVAWRYQPSKVWDDYVLTDRPEDTEFARKHGRDVVPLTPLADAQAQIAALQERLEAARGDAQRWRALLELIRIDYKDQGPDAVRNVTTRADAAIDSARGKDGGAS